MKKSGKPGKVSDSVTQLLHSYALVASAAGVATFALAPLSEAEIIYTPTNQDMGVNAAYALDLNADGTTDFVFRNSLQYGTGYSTDWLYVYPGLAGNAIAGNQRSPRSAAALQSGHRIGPKTKLWGSGFENMGEAQFYTGGTVFFYKNKCLPNPWKNKQNRYLGLKFMISGEIHYGWARLSVSCVFGLAQTYVDGVLTGYAYETIPNQAIKAGQEAGTDDGVQQPDNPAALTQPAQTPATLGMLARGSSALSTWRQKQSSSDDK